MEIPTSVVADALEELMDSLQKNPQGLNQAELSEKLPHLEVKVLCIAINKLSEAVCLHHQFLRTA